MVALSLLGSSSTRADLTLANDATTSYVIVLDTTAPEPERYAARELADHLRQVTGAEFPVQLLGATDKVPRRAICVGGGPVVRGQFPDLPWNDLRGEEIVLRTQGEQLLLAGGQPRGTLYAVSRFLQDQAGVRWWTPWATRVPKQATLRVPTLNTRAQPAFESRDPFWFVAFDATWAVRNFSNSQNANIPETRGGAVRYKGFVHTFYPLVPPEEHFATHPEWYSLIDGKRTHNRAQLCLTNPQLRNFVTERVRAWLKESPEATIVSISQNDWHGACQCEPCKALDDAEETHAGTMLDFVNDIAGRLEKEFPRVAFDTLAYQYTRKPPKTLRPRDNVLIRLCSIECNFREPLDHPSNQAFADDIRGWAKIAPKLYIWDYTTDFGHYVQPHPNWYVLGSNLRFFYQHQVRGVFEQGAYQSHGSEMAELRAWVLAQLLWNPFQDDRALIREFVTGYYGDAAAPAVLRYLDLLHGASAGYKLGCFSKTDTPFHNFATLAAAEKLWDEAEAAAKGSPDHLLRLRIARLPVRYVWLNRWEALRKECTEANATWPLSVSRRRVAEEFEAVARGVEGAPWTRLTRLNENGMDLDKFVAKFATDPVP